MKSAGTTPVPLRVLVVAHVHPAFSAGGGELAAWRLYHALRQTSDITAWFMACAGDRIPDRATGTFQQPFGADEFVYRADHYDPFMFFNRTPGFAESWQALLQRLRPDVIHLHHYVNLGIEALLVARRALPGVRLVLTLHEFSAICHHHGQMVTKPERALCDEATPVACNRCFAEYPANDFARRRRTVLRFLKLVDAYIAPSRFLAERYGAWGLPGARIAVIDNITPPPAAATPRAVAGRRPGKALRCGFFGQITPFKGVRLLLEAARLLMLRDAPPVQVEIHGDDAIFAGVSGSKMDALRREAPACVTFHGAYRNDRVHALMRAVDVVVVPSLWWENAPTVIEEALHAGRPVICADIGGMAEKIRDGIDGLHFMAGSSTSLADTIEALAADPALLTRLTGGLRRPTAPESILSRHLALYRKTLDHLVA